MLWGPLSLAKVPSLDMLLWKHALSLSSRRRQSKKLSRLCGVASEDWSRKKQLRYLFFSSLYLELPKSFKLPNWFWRSFAKRRPRNCYCKKVSQIHFCIPRRTTTTIGLCFFANGLLLAEKVWDYYFSSPWSNETPELSPEIWPRLNYIPGGGRRNLLP